MKKTFTFLSMLIATIVCEAQITINASDVPLPGTVSLMEYANATSQSSGTNQNWNVASFSQVGPTSVMYQPENIPYWLGLGVDVYRLSSKYITSSLVYDIYAEIDKSNTGFNEIGFNVPAQSYSISAFTGNATDSLVFPEQDIIYSSPKTLLPFPFTSTTHVSSSGRRVVAFTVNAPALGLNNTSFTHVLNEVRKDSVIGWGKMRVYTASGASAPVDVLMDKIINYSVDSFYMGTTPAPPAILTAFGVTQGQRVNTSNAINFVREGHFNYLFRLFYGADSTFGTIAEAYSHLDDVAPLGIQQVEDKAYQTLVYPNPCKGGNIHIQVIGKRIQEPTVVITDMLGNIVQEQKLTEQVNGLMQVSINSVIKAGNYTLSIRDKTNNLVVKELMTIQH